MQLCWPLSMPSRVCLGEAIEKTRWPVPGTRQHHRSGDGALASQHDWDASATRGCSRTCQSGQKGPRHTANLLLSRDAHSWGGEANGPMCAVWGEAVRIQRSRRSQGQGDRQDVLLNGKSNTPASPCSC